MPDGTQDLIDRAVNTLHEALASPELPLRDRALLAMRLLELTQRISPPEPWSGFETPSNTPSNTPISNSQEVISPIASSIVSPIASAIHHPIQSTIAGLSQPSTASILYPQVVQIDDFLSPEVYQYALNTALTHGDQFVESQTTTNADDYRRSSILYATLYPDLYELLRQRLLGLLPSVLDELNLEHFEPGQVEMQLTAHNDGCFYKIHNDSGSPETETRILTYVYYFYQEPKRFSGGELRLYETDMGGSMVTASDWFKTIEPVNNRIVFFDSRCKHEVLPVVCPSRSFQDSRFTLNGWIRSA